jgi:predicted nuclease with RNAse H fold
MNIWGVDYGSKMAGTTAIAIWSGNSIEIIQSAVKKDADQFLKKAFETHNPELIGLDAPLSLPGVYRGMKGYKDYMYRQCDRSIGAMSPMFLGGLTARAMRMAAFFRSSKCRVLEVYPGGLAKELFSDIEGYKKKDHLEQWIPIIQSEFEGINVQSPENWHQFDALLALRSAIRITQQQCKIFGSEDEGMIYV